MKVTVFATRANIGNIPFGQRGIPYTELNSTSVKTDAFVRKRKQ